jgi:opine dehydrogenase
MGNKMKIAVLGSGNGGCVVAFDWAKHGHDVNLFDFERFPDNIRAIRTNGGIQAVGALEGFASVSYAGHDLKQTLDGADIILVVGPAYSTRAFAEACKPYLRHGQTVIVLPGSCGGSIEFKNGAGLQVRDQDIAVAETSTLPYGVRVLEPGKIRVHLKLKAGVLAAAVPARDTTQVIEKIGKIYPSVKPAKNVLQTSLENDNPVIHPAITLLNVGLIERTAGNFLFYEEGVTPAVGRLIKALDEERISIGRKLSIEIKPDPETEVVQGYSKETSYDRGFSEGPGFKGVKAPKTLDDRYFNEDVGYGLVFMHSLAEQIDVDTPCISSVIRLASLVMNRDYLREAKRTMKSLGLSGRTAKELETMLA